MSVFVFRVHAAWFVKGQGVGPGLGLGSRPAPRFGAGFDAHRLCCAPHIRILTCKILPTAPMIRTSGQGVTSFHMALACDTVQHIKIKFVR
jgi:hypothetical protein